MNVTVHASTGASPLTDTVDNVNVLTPLVWLCGNDGLAASFVVVSSMLKKSRLVVVDLA